MGAQPRLTLRPLVAADARAYGDAAAEEPGATAALGPATWPFDPAAEIAVWEPDPLRNAFAVEEDGRFVGVVALQTSGPHEAEASYWVRRTERGRGIATEALRLLTARGPDRVWLEIEPDNAASLRVAEKAGYRFESRRAEDGWLIYVAQPPP